MLVPSADIDGRLDLLRRECLLVGLRHDVDIRLAVEPPEPLVEFYPVDGREEWAEPRQAYPATRFLRQGQIRLADALLQRFVVVAALRRLGGGGVLPRGKQPPEGG